MNQSYKAYSRATHTVSKTRQVVMLYDGMIRFLQQAIEAMEKKDFEARYHKLMRVSDIIIGLQACLDFDSGGPSAKILFDFYSRMDMRIFALNRSNDVKKYFEANPARRPSWVNSPPAARPAGSVGAAWP